LTPRQGIRWFMYSEGVSSRQTTNQLKRSTEEFLWPKY
jgi:hypothetical protein